MISKQRGEFVAECNDCGAEEYGGITEAFLEFLAQIKLLGWNVKNNGGDWEHYCPSCSEERGIS